ncbi:MAG TPA: coenzyme F420-0:L-glutamate ligase [Propionibacteriaceae bacterium]|nr:coenzyme F420-0:L-glutamate ligase [Propionibacteriaceae bacterium]
MISIFAPAGLGEISPGADLPGLIVAAVASDPAGPLDDGDIVVVTSKIVSKAEGRYRPAAEREQAIEAESIRTVARRGPTRIVRTRHGLTLAAAGVDNSNVAPDQVLLLPLDPDASAARLRRGLTRLTGRRLGVVLSDTAGRAWRIGQTDQAIGASGVQVFEHYAGRIDGYGNELQVTQVALADELAAAADLVKSKLTARPVAVVRGLADVVLPDDPAALGGVGDRGAAMLVRDEATDLFRHGSREAVLAAVLSATGQADRYEELLALASEADRVEAAITGSGLDGGEAALLRRVLAAALAE